MEGQIYYTVITERQATPGQETATLLQVTQELNGYAVWLSSAEYGNQLLGWFTHRTAAINYAADNRQHSEEELREYTLR